MDALFSKFPFGKDKAEEEARRRKREEDAEDAELRAFTGQQSNGAKLLALFRTSAASAGTIPTSGTELEEMLVSIAGSLPVNAAHVWPRKLVRIFLSRFSGHLIEPAVRLPIAAKALLLLLRATPCATYFVECGVLRILEQMLNIAVEELEQRSASNGGPPPSSSSVAEGRGDGGASSPVAAASSFCRSPLFAVTTFSVQCFVLLDERGFSEPASPSSSSGLGIGQQLAFWKKKDKKERVAYSSMGARVLQETPVLAAAIRRLFGIQCRCGMPTTPKSSGFHGGEEDDDVIQSSTELFDYSCRAVALLATADANSIGEITSGACIVLVRLCTELQSGDTTRFFAVRGLLAEAGHVLRTLADCFLKWPLKSAGVIRSEGPLGEQIASTIRLASTATILSCDVDASDNASAAEALQHFFSDVKSERHWRDMSDSLNGDVNRLLMPSKQDKHTAQWLDGLTKYLASLQAAMEHVKSAAYRNELTPQASESSLATLVELEVTSIVGAFSTVPATPGFSRGSTDTNASSSVMRRWFLTHLLSLLPMNPTHVKPIERGRVQCLHRFVRQGSLIAYLIGDPRSGWTSDQQHVLRIAAISLLTRYLLISDEALTIGTCNNGGGAKGVATPASAAIVTVFDALEHYGQLANSGWSQGEIALSVIPLCCILRWYFLARESGAIDLTLEYRGTATLANCASALGKTTSQVDGSALQEVLSTLHFILKYPPVLRFALQQDPSSIIHLMFYPAARSAAAELVVALLCYDGDSEPEEDYRERMANLVTDLWDITTNSREVPDEVYLALFQCVRTAIDAALDRSPLFQMRLQSALCSPVYAADCFVRLVLPLNAGWHTLPADVGRPAVLATLTSLIRANPVIRERFAGTVGGEPLVKSVFMSCHHRMTKTVAQELLGLIFEEPWTVTVADHGDVPIAVPASRCVTVQNEIILEATLVQFIAELGGEGSSAPFSGSGSNASNDAAASTRESNIEALMVIVERLRISFSRCRASVWSCATQHAFEHLVTLLPMLDQAAHVASMEACLSMLTARHINIRQLKRLVGVISHAEGIAARRRLLPNVVEILHAACHTHLNSRGEPKNYLALRSRSGPAGVSITVPQFPKSGYTVSLWVRWEGNRDRSDAATLLSIESTDAEENLQPQIRLDISNAGLLLLTVGTCESVPLEGAELMCNQWTHVVLAQRSSLFPPSDLTTFVNGKELTTVKANYPAPCGVFPLSLLVGSDAATVLGKRWSSPLHGQVNAIYLFSKAFAHRDVNDLFRLGASHASCFPTTERSQAGRSAALYDQNIGEKIVVCVDPRLSEKGKLFNAVTVAKLGARSASSATIGSASTQSVSVVLHEGALTCQTSSIIDTTCSLGALQSLILPLLIMQVNGQLPISPKGLAVDPNSLLSPTSTVLRDTLKLLDSLIVVDVVRAEALTLNFFTLLTQILEKLGTRMNADIPTRLGKICTATADSPALFQTAFRSSFLSVPLFQSSSFTTRVGIISTMRGMCQIPEVKSSMRDLGVSHHLGALMIKCCNSNSADDVGLRDAIFALLDIMVVTPIQRADAETLLVVAVEAMNLDESVAEHLLARSRALILSRPRELCQHLGKIEFCAVLLPLLKHPRCSVRCNATRMLTYLVCHSKATQQLLLSFAPPHRANDDRATGGQVSTAEAHIANGGDDAGFEAVPLTFVGDILRAFPLTVETYLSVRSAMTCANENADTTHIAPLSESERLVFPPAFVAFLMLVREASVQFRVHALTDVFTLVCADTTAWSKIFKLPGWYILILDVMLADDDCNDDADAVPSPRSSLRSSAKPAPESDAMVAIPPGALMDVGVQLIAAILAQAVCSAQHDCEEIDLALTYIQGVRHDPRVAKIACDIHSQVVETCSMRMGIASGSSSPLSFSPPRPRKGSATTTMTTATTTSAGTQGLSTPSSASINNATPTLASVHGRHGLLASNPIIDRNLQVLFYSIEDRLFFGYDIEKSIKSYGKADGFVHVDAEEVEYHEEKSHWCLSSDAAQNVSLTSFPSAQQVELLEVPSSAHLSPDAVQPAAQEATSKPTTEWLHADLALKALQLLSGSVSLVNSSTVAANISSETYVRRGGMQRIFLRILRCAVSLLAMENDMMEVILNAVKQFQLYLDKASSTGFFAGKRSAADVQESPGIRSALSVVLILHSFLQKRRRVRGGAGGRNRFINQRAIDRLKSGIQSTIPVLRELGAFQKHSATHLDATHRVAVKTIDWIEQPQHTDVDEYFEISQREDYRLVIQLITDIVRTYEDQGNIKVRDIAVRYHAWCSAKVHATLKLLVMNRQEMMESIDVHVTSGEVQNSVATVRDSVLGDGATQSIAAATAAAHWSKFVAHLRGTIWDTDPSEKNLRYLKLARVEQRPLVHYKLFKDKEGTDHREITDKLFPNPTGDDNGDPSLDVSHRTVRLKRRNSDNASAEEDDELAAQDDALEEAAAQFTDTDEAASADASLALEQPHTIKVACELSHLMHCWSCTFLVTESTMTILLDEENRAYNQLVAKDATQYLIRPRSIATWPLIDIATIAPGRRFRMRRVAVEITFRDRSSILLNFPTVEVMRSAVQTLKRSALLSLSYRSFNSTLVVLNENPRKELLKSRATELWTKRKMTNFDYLLTLNALAGRTVNDLTQYPIFPWVVADYRNETLDLSSPDTFRDLSNPVGLCGKNRREEIQMRYDEMLQMGDVPFHYFTHYSSPAVVLYFLVRVEPFTTCQILLQGGRFDHADRMFHSVEASWMGVTKNIQDVKEMVPECYYLPEMYVNNNHVRFGTKQDKKEMSDAELPPWAKGDPYTLVFRLREALECDHVSSQLHHWIDLIFGYKQRGRPAVEALNLFHPHTYEVERADHLTVSQTSEERNLVIDSLDNIGQTPIQLFVKKHPERKAKTAMNPIIDSSAFGYIATPLAVHSVDRVAMVKVLPSGWIVVVAAHGGALLFRWTKTTVHVRKESTPSRYRLDGVMKKFEDLRSATASFELSNSVERKLPPLPLGCMPSICLEVAKSVPSQPRGAGSSLAAAGRGSGNSGASGVEDLHAPCSWRNTTVLHLADDNIFVVHGGFFDNSCVIRPLSAPCDEFRFSAHRDVVLCLASSEDSSYVVTGGRDTTFLVWSIAYNGRLSATLQFSICGHEDEPSCVAVSNELDLVATASCDGQWMLHTLSTGKLEQCFSHPSNSSVDFFLLQSQCYVPNILVASKVDHTIHQYSLNGNLLRSVALPSRLVQWSFAGDPTHLMVLLAPQNILSNEHTNIAYYHSFFLTQTSKISPQAELAASEAVQGHVSAFASPRNDNWLTCIDAHPTNAQIMCSGTANGTLILIRTEATRSL